MPSRPQVVTLVVVALTTLALAGCGTLGPEDVASVTVSPATASVEVARTTQLSAEMKDDKGQPLQSTKLVLSWSSANPNVATVDTTGLVRLVGIGTSRITASIGQASGSAEVTGLAGAVNVTPAAATAEAGKTVQLTATVNDADGKALSGVAVTWSTGDAAIATVSSTGLVTGVAPGAVTITATAGGKSGTAAVTVTGPAPTISSVTPNNGTVGTELAIVGTNFRAGISVFVGTLAADMVDRVSDTQVFALVPQGVTAGTAYGVTVRNSDGTEATRASAFTAVAPLLQFVNSATKPSGQIGSTVILEGTAFGDIQGAGKVLFSDGTASTIQATIASAADWTNTFIVTTVPSGTKTGDMVVVTATGTSNALKFTVTEAATFSPSVINWQATADLPVAVSGHEALFVPIDDASGNTVPHVHVTGGASNNNEPRTDVVWAMIQANGTVSGWNTATALPEGRAFHASAAATPFNSRVKGSGYLYVLGGIAVADGQPVTTVYSARLNADGTVGSWTTGRALPAPLHSLGAAEVRSFLYVAGGSTTDNVPVTTVYRAAIDTLGALGPWEALPELPAARSYHAFATFGGYLYAVGGDAGNVTPNNAGTTVGTKYDNLVYVRVDLRTGALAATSWTVNTEKLIKNMSKHTALVAGGNFFVTGGLYVGASTGASENSFAQLNADGSTGQFLGATGGNTIRGEGGGNLFNHAAITYVDANGVAHVMVLGGDDVNNPGT
ncbi:MAG: Ig-like domain-containing protein, partial [Gemmatimonadetes bacterium]|nr:Ig-like domain-containing protein [Gemmatimonadota bacterium]